MHAKYFADPSPTDCMTFPIDPPDQKLCIVLGEIFVCPEVAVEKGKEIGEDPFDECALYIVHGLLHLLGFKDRTEDEQKQMRAEERLALDYLSKKDALLRDAR